MALIVKCKCGKQMKVATALAGKKLSCPGCKKSFSIPLERFKIQAPPAPTAVRSAPVPAAAPPARPPAPKPPPVAELLATPSELDLLSGFDQAPSGIIGDMSDLLAPVCPSCSVSLGPDAKICVKCGYDLRTGKHIAGESATALPVQDVGYARPKTASPRDAIHGPGRGYWADAFHAFVYPFQSGGNILTFAIILIVAMLGAGLAALDVIGIFLLIGRFIIFGYFASLFLSVVRDTASGFSELPGIKMEDGFLEDIIKPAFKYMGAYACAIAPAVVYLLAAYFGVVPESLRSGWAFLLWLTLGIFLLPMFIMFFAFDALSMLWRVDLIVTTIFRTFLPYICLWILLSIVNFESVLGVAASVFEAMGVNLALPRLPDLGMAGIFVYRALGVYVTIVTMRQIGLYYLHFKKRFTLVFE